MRRALAMLATTALLVWVGCGGKSYDIRLNKTLDRMKYEKRLNDNLIPAPKGKFESLLIFVRPPKALQQSKEFTLSVIEPGKFDLAESFFEADKQNMHALAWVKRPKDTSKKKGATKPDPAANRDFNTFGSEVVAILNGVYGVELDAAKAKEAKEKDNVYRHLKFEGNGKVVQLYLNAAKGAPYAVALIFEYPKTEEAALTSKIKLCLESFATGERARKAFAGNATEEEAEPGAGGKVAF